jgi:hypothetical protein
MMPPPMTTASARSGRSGVDGIANNGAGMGFSWPDYLLSGRFSGRHTASAAEAVIFAEGAHPFSSEAP